MLILPWALSAGNNKAAGLIFISFVYSKSLYIFKSVTFLMWLESEIGVSVKMCLVMAYLLLV